MALGDEDLDAFDALEAALMAELAPEGALQAVLVRRIVAATWRLERAERMEAELYAQNMRDTARFGLGLIRDCNGPRAFDTLLRYRGTTLAEFWRALRMLKVLQAEAAAQAAHQEAAVAPGPVGERGPNPFLVRAPGEGETEIPSKPERRTSPRDTVPAPAPAPTPAPAAGEPAPATVAAHVAASGSAPARPAPQQPPCSAPGGAAPAPQRIEPKRRTNPGESAPMPREIRGVAALLAAAPVPPGRHSSS